MDSVCAEKGGFGGQTASTPAVGLYPVLSISFLMVKYHIYHVCMCLVNGMKKVNLNLRFQPHKYIHMAN